MALSATPDAPFPDTRLLTTVGAALIVPIPMAPSPTGEAWANGE